MTGLYGLNTLQRIKCIYSPKCLYSLMVYKLATGIAITFAIFIVGSSVGLLQLHSSHQTSAAAQPQQQTKKLDCPGLGQTLGGISVPSGNVCDVVLVRKSPEIMGHNGLVMNKFTLMNSVLEFMAANATNTTSSQSPTDQSVYVMGDFALLESEMNPVLQLLKNAGWTVTGIHNHMVLESPKTTFMHWETQGDLNTIIGQINDALAQTSIRGPK
jgi:Domain of Unknown Function (DUF1259)